MSLVDFQEHNKNSHFMPNSLLVDLIQYFIRMLSRKFIKIKVSYVSYIVIDILINHHSPQTFPYIDLSPRDLHSVAYKSRYLYATFFTQSKKSFM